MTNYYEPKLLRGAIEKSIPPKTFFRSRFFSRSITFPTETVSFEFSKAKRVLLPYASIHGASTPITREGYQLRTYRAPLISGSRAITPYTLQDKLFGESEWNSGKAPDDRAREIAARDLADLQEALIRRQEYMCARVKQDGKLEIDGRGVAESVDYHFENIEEVTKAADKWSNTKYSILNKLLKILRKMRRDGVNPDMLIVGEGVAEALSTNEELLRLRHDEYLSIPDPGSLENGVTYLFNIRSAGINLNVYEYLEYYTDTENNVVPLVDPGTVIIQSSREKNYMLHGVVTYLNHRTREYVSSMGEYIPYVVAEEDPPVRKLVLSSRCLPMPADVESWYVLKNVI